MKDNVLNSIGDVLLIDVVSKITGNVVLSDYYDTIIGVTEDRKVNKEYRVSSNRIFWSEWKTLNSDNLSSMSYDAEGELLIQLRYTRDGVDETGVIEFVNINFIGLSKSNKLDAPTINSSIFSDLIGTEQMNSLEDNLFKKLYYRGIVPNYITRAENSDDNEDKDYIDLFFSIARFYAMFISFFKRFENFSNDFDLLREQIRQYGIYFNESEITLDELQYLAKNINDQIRQRGTDMVFKRKGYQLPGGEVLKIDGELIRLLRNKTSDELVYENIPLENAGWCISKSSPMYKGTCSSKNINKTREQTEDFQHISNYVISSIGNSSYSLKQYDGKKVLSLSINSGGVCGIGRINEDLDIDDNMYNVDSRLDYEITFAFQIVGNSKKDLIIQFGVEGFDALKNKLTDSFITPNGFEVTETFFELRTVNTINSIWYHVRGIIHSYSTVNSENIPTNIGVGNNLHFNNSFVKYILPKIQIKGSTNACEVYIWNYKIRPLVRGTNIRPLKDGSENSHSLGFIESSRIFYLYARNNNNGQSQSEITDIIEKYLLPFNVTDIITFMSNY